MKAEQREQITETLAAHGELSFDDIGMNACICGRPLRVGTLTEELQALVRHQAAVLAPVVDTMLAEARRDVLVEAADEADRPKAYAELEAEGLLDPDTEATEL